MTTLFKTETPISSIILLLGLTLIYCTYYVGREKTQH